MAIWWQSAEERAIRALPEPERRSLYARTLENLATACAAPSEGLFDFCEAQARLALEFAECDGTCQALAERQLSRVPHRR